QFSVYNFETAEVPRLWEHFNSYEAEAQALLAKANVLLADEHADPKAKKKFPLLATYELALKCSNLFNLLDARGAISVTERAAYIRRIRALACLVAQSYFESRERLGFPMAPREWVAQMAKKAA
ncbi:MAG: glycine--tRNA ligase subunit alpha, partial [Rhodoferax sp.]